MITSFTGSARFLSNFWPVPILVEGRTFPSVEHAYQAMKSDNPLYRDMLAGNISAGEAKRMGRNVKLRLDWNDRRLDIMEALLRIKFLPGTQLAAQLVATAPCELVESNSWGDNFWGVSPPVPGHNHLGRLLMKIRDELEQAAR